MSGNGGITNYPPTTQQNQICWVGVPNDSDLVMFLNSDLNNYAYIGYSPTLVVGVNTIPIAPNASINLPANRTVYAIWSVTAGVSPLVVIPGGASYFLGITQGLGNLAIPSVQSPNFVHTVSGWQIDKNGNAEFNNLSIRGTFFGTDYILNANGFFFYSGTPASGNMVASYVPFSQLDPTGFNLCQPGWTSYENASGIFYASSAQGGGFVLAKATAPGGPYTTYGVVGNDGNVPPNMLLQATNDVVTPSEFQFQNVLDIAQLTAPALLANFARLWSDFTSNALKFNGPTDGNVYALGTTRNIVSATIPINSTSPIVICQLPVAALQYRIHCQIVYVASATAASATIGWDGNATISNTLGTLRRGRGNGNSDNVLPVNQNSALGNENLPYIANETDTYEFDGMVTFSAAGVFNIRGQQGTAGDLWSVATNSYLELSPV